MSHYTFQNISEESQKGTIISFETVGYLSEAFVFAYLGLSIIWIETDEYNFIFTFCLILILFFARFVGIFMLPCIFFIFKKEIKLKIKELKIIWYSGLIRGNYNKRNLNFLFNYFLFNICLIR